jgi:hypothetical protein
MEAALPGIDVEFEMYQRLNIPCVGTPGRITGVLSTRLRARRESAI